MEKLRAKQKRKEKRRKEKQSGAHKKGATMLPMKNSAKSEKLLVLKNTRSAKDDTSIKKSSDKKKEKKWSISSWFISKTK